MLRLLTSITLFIALLTTGVLPSHAYWLESPQPEPFTMPGEREKAPPSNQKGILTVQDNFNLFTKQDGTSPMLLPHTDYFVPADIININIPIFSIFSHPPQQAGDPIANLLYANLKIKKLLEEYAAIQKRAKELLSTTPGNLPSGKMQTAGEISIRQEILQQEAALSTLRTEIIHAGIPGTETNSTPSKNRIAIASLHHLQKTIETQQKQSKLSVPPPKQTGKILTPNTINNQLPTYPQQNKQPSRRQDHRSADTGSIELPFLLELPFKIFNYLLTHKIQALIMGFMALMFFNIIFGSRS